MSTKVPKSKATNAYELLDEIQALILEEPKRVWMDDWVIKGKHKIETTLAYSNAEVTAPACNTVGCIAGWMVSLRHPRQFPSEYAEAALMLLGTSINYEADDELAYNALNLFYGQPPYPFPTAPYGTKAYARAVVNNIKRFKRKWKTRLKATPLRRRS